MLLSDQRKCSELEDFDPCATYPSDRGHFRERLSDDLVNVLVKVGSCQPNTIINSQSERKFNPALYYYRQVYNVCLFVYQFAHCNC